MKSILAPIDFSDATASVLGAATMLAHAFRAKIVITHVMRPTTIVNTYSPEVAALVVEEETNESKQLSYWQRELQNDGLAVEKSELYGVPSAYRSAACDRRRKNRTPSLESKPKPDRTPRLRIEFAFGS